MGTFNLVDKRHTVVATQGQFTSDTVLILRTVAPFPCPGNKEQNFLILPSV